MDFGTSVLSDQASLLEKKVKIEAFFPLVTRDLHNVT